MDNQSSVQHLSNRVSRFLILLTLALYLIIVLATLQVNNRLSGTSAFLAASLIGATFIVSILFNINADPSVSQRRYAILFYHAVLFVLQWTVLPPLSFLSIVYVTIIMLVEYYFDLRYVFASILAFGINGGLITFVHKDEITADTFLSFLIQVTLFLLVALIIETTRRQSRFELSAITANLKWSAITKKRYEQLINNIGEAVIATDESGLIVLYNYELQNILNTNEDLHNRKLEDAVSIVDKNNVSIELKDLTPKTSVPNWRNDLFLKREDETIPISISIANVPDQYRNEAVFKQTIVIRDFTQEKSLEDEKSEFISVVSHELRTPIAIAEGNISNAQIVNEHGSNDEKIKDALDATHEQIVFLADMVNDLDTLTRADKNTLDAELTSIDPKLLVDEIIAQFASAATKKDIKLTSRVQTNHQIITSKEFLKSIIEALVDNAIKYTDEGYVEIRVVKSDKGIKFEVEDTGSGISNKDLPKVFDKFFRSEDYRTREHGGTGLGLYVALKLSMRINAELTATSEVDKGSIFYLDIPSLGVTKQDYKKSSKIELGELLKGL